MTRAVLNGEPGPRRDVVLLNAGAALLISGQAATLEQGILLAAKAIDSGRAMAVLNNLITFTNACANRGA